MGGKWRVWVGVLAVFACGLAIGAAGGSLYERHRAVEHIGKMRQDRGSFMAEMALERLNRELGLSAEQRVVIKPLLLNAFQEGDKLIRSVRPKLDAILKGAVQQIRPHLTPPQIEKLEAGHGFRLLIPPPPPGGHPGGPPGPPPGPPPHDDQPDGRERQD